MKLSIYSIYDEIYTDGSYLKSPEKITFDLSGVRIYSERYESLSEDILYVIYPNKLINFLSDPNLHFVCIGFSKEIYEYSNSHSIIFLPEGTDIYYILNSLQDMFDRYYNWMESVNNSILTKKSLQYTFDLCSKFLKNPISLFDNNQSLLLKSGDMPKNIDGSLWAFVLKNGASPKSDPKENSYVYDRLLSSEMPFYYNSNDQYKKNTRLIAGIRINNTIFGCIATTDINIPITNMEYINLHYVQKFMENALLNSSELQLYSSQTPWYITKLLNGDYVEKSVISYNLSLKSQLLADKFYLWCFRIVNDSSIDEYSIRKFIPSFSRQFKTDFVFYFKNQIIVFDYNIEKYNDNKYKLNILDFLSLTGFRGAYSMLVDNIYDIHDAYVQCQLTIEDLAMKYPEVYSFQKYYVYYILEILKINTPFNNILYPGIKKLLSKDYKYGIELLRCLEVFIIKGKNISSTAEQLFIHRHTVIYRLNSISKFMNIDLNKLDDDSLFHILLSCKLLLNFKNSTLND